MQTRDRKTKQEPKKDGNVFFRIEPEIKLQYDEYCLENGFSIGKRLRSLIKSDLIGKLKIEK